MKLFKYLFWVIVICFSALSLMAMLYRKGQSNFLKVEQPVKEMINGKENYDILFLGSSRASAHVNPYIIDSITGVSSYNAGHPGFNIIEMNLMLQCYLEKHTPPKLIVAELAINTFHTQISPIYSPVEYFRFMDDENVSATLTAHHKRARLWKYFSFMEICEADEMQKVQAAFGLLGKKERLSGYKGYKENEGLLPISFATCEDPTDFKVTPEGLTILNHLIATCKKNNVDLVFTYSPEYYRLHHKTEEDFFKSINEVCAKNKIPFFNYRSHELSRQSHLFADPVHLNSTGATEFSKLLGNDVNRYIKQREGKIDSPAYYTSRGY